MAWEGQVPTHPVEVAGCVYVEVPKAGCTSVKWALSPLKGGPPDDEDIHHWFGYTNARSVGELYEWLGTRWAHLFRFTVVRDPIERFRSFYFGLQPWEQGAYGDLDRYVLNEFERDERWRWDIHAIPQTLLVGSELERFDYVGRTENMAEVEAVLREQVDPSIALPHLNQSGSEGYEIGPRALKRLRSIYRRDLNALGYA